jgi:hypothetical protein
MNRALKNAEQRAKAAAANRGAANYSGNWAGNWRLPTPAAPLRMLAVGQLGIRFPANCGVVPPSEGFRLPVITSNQTMWGGILCADGTWVQSWMGVLEPTDSLMSLEALADRELASWGGGLFEASSGELGPQSITRTYNSDPRGVCRGSVNVENDGRYYTFMLCYPNTQQALWTKDVITSNLSRLAPE